MIIKKYESKDDMIKYKEREATISKMASDLDNCVTMYNFFEDDQKYNYVFEMCSEGDLEDFRKRHRNARFTEVEAMPFVRQLIKGLAGLHAKGIVLRDIKPANILVSKGKVKYCDFGGSRIIPENNDIAIIEPNDPFKTTVIGSGYY